MKTITKRFLKASVAMLLVVIMLFGSTITGFAAAVDKAETKANTELAETGATTVYFQNNWKWTDVKCYYWTSSGNNGWPGVSMSKVDNDGTYDIYSFSLPSGTTGFIFNGLKNDNSGNRDQSPDIKTVPSNNNTMYYMKWANNSNQVGTTTYSNDVTATFYDGDEEFDSQTITSGTAPTKPATDPSKTGYTFVGWSLTEGGDVITSFETIDEDTSYYAVYEINRYTITYNYKDANGGNALKKETIEHGYTPSYVPPVRNDGYVFTGWDTTPVPATGDATYNAQYELAKYTITFNDDDGTLIKNVTTEHGSMPELPDNPTKAGHTFAGWNPTVVEATGDKTYVATYTINKYTATFVDWDGKELGTSTVNYNTPATAPADPTREGYDFDGWDKDFSKMTDNITVTATYKIKTYDVTVTVEGGDHGTIKLGNEDDDVLIATVDHGSNLAVVVTPEDGYAVDVTIDGVEQATGAASYSSTITNITSEKSITVKYVDIKCYISFTDVSKSLRIGEEYTNTLNKDSEYCLDTHKITYKSSAPTVVSVDANGKVTALASGNATITATCETGATAEYSVTVLQPKLKYSTVELELGETITLEPYSVENAPVGDYEIVYSSHVSNNGYYTLDGANVTGIKPTGSNSPIVTVTMKYNGTIISGATEPFSVKVSEPTANVNKDSIKLFSGHTFTAELELDDIYNAETCTIDWAVNDTGATAITVLPADDKLSANIVAGASILSGGEVTATITYATGYIKTVTINVDVVTPTINTNKSSLSLEYGDGSSKLTDTFTVSTNLSSVEGSCDLDDTITVTTENSSIATASISGTTVTVNAKGLGSTNVVISFHGETKKITVNVKEAETWEYIYVTDNLGWNSMKIYYWTQNGGSETADMVKIGKNKDEQKDVYAFRFKKGDTPDWFILKQSDNWGNDICTEIYAYVPTGYYFKNVNQDLSTDSDSDARETLGTWTVNISIPAVSVDANDITMVVGETQTVTASHSGSSTKWVVEDTSIATASSTSVKNPTFTGKAKGRTTATVYAIASLTNSSFSSFNTSNTAALPYIAGSATANVRVTRAATDTDITIYLSSGRKDMGFTPSTSIVGLTGTSVGGTSESYTKYQTTFRPVDLKATLAKVADSGYEASDFMVDSFVVYKIESRTYEIYDASEMDSTTFTATTDVLVEDCYIYPVYFFSESYITTNELDEMEFYFEAPDLDFDIWGPFVSCYAYGKYQENGVTKEKKYFGNWTGQLMIPTEDGKSFYTKIALDKDNMDDLTGVLFNNGVFTDEDNGTPLKTNLYKLYNELGLSGNRNIQTYDYREPKTLFGQGYSSITYVMKQNLDGYHGDHPDSSNNKTYNVSSSVNVLDKGYNFDYLYRRNGKTLMDLNGNAIEDVSASSGPEADYYVVTKGDVTWGYNSSDNIHPDGFDGYWGVTWYVYNKTGAFIGQGNSDYFYYKDGTTDPTSELIDDILTRNTTMTSADFDGKVVKISYEAGNDCPTDQKVDGDVKSTQYSYDGQWYGTNPYDTMHANVIVGLENKDGSWTLESDDTPNISDVYGEGYLVTATGEYAAEEDITIRDGNVALTASAKEHYKFVGWYTSKDIRLTENYDYSGYINNDTTYYAIFKRLGEKEVIISHSKYNNTYPGLSNDAIRPHNGTAIMKVEVYDSNGNLVKAGYDSTSRSYVSFEAEEHASYKVKIYTTPQNKDTFFAWYTDSLDADGNPTYEEMLTSGDDVGRTKEQGTITTEFIYHTDSGDQNVNIYSDLIKVSVYATLEYNYYNRYNQLRVISKTVKLTDQEVEGFDGNDTTPYCPAYLDYYYFGEKESATIYYNKNEAVTAAKAAGVDPTTIKTGNNITDLAPNFEVTEAVNQEIRWTVDEKRLTHSGSYVKLVAEQKPVQYTVYYTIEEDTLHVTKYYNDLLDIEAPVKNSNGDTFCYWKDLETDEIISYSRFYSYRIVEDRRIEAVYGAKEYNPWSAVIENVTQTREYQDYELASTDVVYIDYLLAFHNVDKKELRTLTDVQYGVVTFFDKTNSVTKDNMNSDSIYPAFRATDEFLKAKVDTIARNKYENVRVKDANGVIYNANHYNLSGSQNLTNLNRMNFVLSLDNKNTDYHKYAFSTYAYIIAKNANGEDVIYISEVKNVNIYETATAKVE